MPQESITLPVGAIVQDASGDRYRVQGLIGKGGFGAVYLVNDRHAPGHEFALKELIEPSGHDLKRLLFECELLKRLDHPSLPRVYHVFEYERLKRVYLLMEYIKGKNLRDLRNEQPDGRFPLKVVLAIIGPIVDALSYLHAQEPPVVHRDIKPGNIIVPRNGGEAVLVDFGTAKEFTADGTTTAFRHGSPGYAPVEQYSPATGTNIRTDVYGLGATLYTLLTGVTPVDAIARLTTEDGEDPLKPAIEIVPDIPRSVSNAIECALSIYNQHRFPSVAAFWKALHSDTFELPDRASQAPLPETPLPATADSETSDGAPLLIAEPRSKTASKNKKVRAFSLAILMLLILGAGSLGIFLFATHRIATTPVPPSSQTLTTNGRITGTSISVTQTSSYPPLASSYAGTISDLGTANTTTELFLSQVQQNPANGTLTGRFQGLGLTGTFTGTITPAGQLHLIVKINVGNLIFDGTIKVGGDLEGNFQTLDQHGNKLGEYGIWYGRPTT